MAGNPVGWFEIYVQDMPRARRFYEQVLGRKLEKLESGGLEMWAFARAEGYGTQGALVHMPGFPAGGNSAIVYFMCEDCAVEESRVVPAGGRIEKKKFSIGPYGFISLVYDTEGTMIGLHSMK